METGYIPSPELFDDLRRQYEAGDNTRLIAAMNLCAQYGVPMPKWVATAWLAATRLWAAGAAKSLDEAIGVARPKGKHAAAIAKKRRLMSRVWNHVKEHRLPVCEDTFNAVGKQFGIGGTLAKEYFYEVDRIVSGAPGDVNRWY